MVVFHEETNSYLFPQKDAVRVSEQCLVIPAHFSQKTTELPLGNGLATGIQLVVWVAGGREDNWVVLWYMLVYWGLL